MAEKNHTLRVQFLKKKIDMCQKHDEVTRFDGTYPITLSPFQDKDLISYEKLRDVVYIFPDRKLH